jgi:hypothetical protein
LPATAPSSCPSSPSRAASLPRLRPASSRPSTSSKTRQIFLPSAEPTAVTSSR